MNFRRLPNVSLSKGETMIVNKDGIKMATCELWSLCVKHNWFTCGTTRQYNKLFEMLEMESSLAEIVTVIWICSDEERVCRRDIFAVFEEAGFKETVA